MQAPSCGEAALRFTAGSGTTIIQHQRTVWRVEVDASRVVVILSAAKNLFSIASTARSLLDGLGAAKKPLTTEKAPTYATSTT